MRLEERSIRRSGALAVALAAGTLLASAQSALAASGTWNVDLGGTWQLGTTSPWLNGIVAEGADQTAFFNTIDITVDRTVTLGAPLVIGNLAFRDTASPNRLWIVNSSTLTLDTSTGAPTVTVTNSEARIGSTLAGNDGLTKEGAGILVLTGNNSYSGLTQINAGTLAIGAGAASGSISGDVSIASGATLKFDRGGTAGVTPPYTFGGTISGLGAVSKTNGVGNLILSGNNTYSGGTTVSAGTLQLGTGTNNGIGTGTLAIDGGRVHSSDNNSRTINNKLTISANSGNIALGAPQDAASGLGDLVFTDTTTGAAMSNGRSLSINNSTSVTFNKQFTSGQLTKSGTGTLILNGASTYSSATTINAGTLLVNNGTGSATGSGLVTIADGAILGGTGNIGGAVSFAADGADADELGGIFKPTSAVDSLSIVGSLTLGTGSVLDLGNLSGLNPALTYTILTYGGTQLTGGFTVVNPVATHSVSYDGDHAVQLVPVPEPTTLGVLGIFGLAMTARRRRGT
jgi:autotransporter-associated beta strand protein